MHEKVNKQAGHSLAAGLSICMVRPTFLGVADRLYYLISWVHTSHCMGNWLK